MENIYFEYQGQQYSGYIISSSSTEATYFWFVFNEDEIIDLLGDSIAFYFKKGRLAPVYHYSRHAMLVEQLCRKVEAAIYQDSSKNIAS